MNSASLVCQISKSMDRNTVIFTGDTLQHLPVQESWRGTLDKGMSQTDEGMALKKGEEG